MKRVGLTMAIVGVLVLAGCMGASTGPTNTTDAGSNATQTSSGIVIPSGATTYEATVTQVTDGDTVEVRLENGTTDTVRLLGVDTPETTLSKTDPTQYGYDDTRAARDFALERGQKAKEYAEQRLAGSEVTVVMDPKSDARGYYGRRLAYIYVGGSDFNLELLREGYARMYDSEMAKRSEYENAESDARSEGVGIWGFEGGGEGRTDTAATARTGSANESGEAPSEGGETSTPSGGTDDPYDCSDFDSQAAAQQWFENHSPSDDPAGLDSDGNGQACEGS